MRRTARCLVASIPRSAWDPQHHDSRWVDSYAKPHADRRSWPAKTFSIVPEPRTPAEYLTYSKRNMAYAYNAAIRACTTFPEMLEYYSEMKLRGVLVDLDTAFALISRGARYERMDPTDLFRLYDELVDLGARADLSVVEVLHTVLDHSKGAPDAWREMRRRQLVDKYNELAREDIRRYGAEEQLPSLMLQQLHRYAANAKSLGGCLRADVWAAAVSHIGDARDLLREVCAMLKYRGEAGSTLVTLPLGAQQLEVPALGDSLIRQPSPDADALPWSPAGLPQPPAGEPFGPEQWEDVALNEVFLAAVNRVVDANFYEHVKAGPNDAMLAKQLLLVFLNSGAFVTSDVFAAIFDIIRFSGNDATRRDKDARVLFKRALRGGQGSKDLAAEWQSAMKPADARVVARYLMSVDPWADTRFDISVAGEPPKPTFEPFSTLNASSGSGAAAGTEAEAEADGDMATAKRAPRSGARSRKEVQERMRNVKFVISRYGGGAKPQKDADKSDAQALSEKLAPFRTPNGMQLMTAQFVFLRRLVEAEATPEVCLEAMAQLRMIKGDLDDLMASVVVQPAAEAAASTEETPLAEGPETEAWESMLATLRIIMDTCVSVGGNVAREQQNLAKRAFGEAEKMRTEVVKQTATAYGGKFRMLWLEEA